MKNITYKAKSSVVEAYAASNMNFAKAYNAVVNGKDNLSIAKDVIILELQETIKQGGVEIGGIFSLINHCIDELKLNDNRSQLTLKIAEEI